MQLLTKALEDSRAQVLLLSREKAEVAEKVAQMLEVVGADVAPLAGSAELSQADPDSLTPLDHLQLQVQQLHEHLQIREVEVAGG